MIYMMELQLGLALPTNSIKGFDLNCYVYEPKEVVGSNPFNRAVLQLGPCFSSKNNNDTTSNNNNNKKRSFDESFEYNRTVPRTLPLLLWNNQPHEDDDPKDLDNHPSFAINKNDGDGDGVVGWPPLKSWRKKHCHQNNRTVDNACGCGVRASNSMFVKVKMEGVPIARKIDLSLYHSFDTLKDTLINMFGKCQVDSNCYKLTYQDSEGDWLLAEDMPWRTFIRSVQRLKLLRSSA